MAGKGGKREGAGRKHLDKTQTLLASKARDHTDTALTKLVSLMNSPTESVVLGAIKEILDRGWGKAPQAIVGDEDKPIELRLSWQPVQK